MDWYWVSFWSTAGKYLEPLTTVIIVVFALILLGLCALCCHVYHAVMADNHDSKFILKNVAYEQMAITLTAGGVALTLMVGAFHMSASAS